MYFCKSCGQPFYNENSKFCEQCGAAKGTGVAFCDNCGSSLGLTDEICRVCGVATGYHNPNNSSAFDIFDAKNQEIENYTADPYNANPYNTDVYEYNSYGVSGSPRKSRKVAGLLAIFLGAFGVHNFYLGKKNYAVTQLTLTIVGYCLYCFGIGIIITTGVSIWAFIEGILILAKQVECDGYGQRLIG